MSSALHNVSDLGGASVSERPGAVSRRPAAAEGLTEEEARRRLAERGGADQIPSSRSYASIIRANVFTVFNLIRRASVSSRSPRRV